MEKSNNHIGRTKDAGWQFGLRKTFHLPQDYLWDFMFSEQGLNLWLGDLREELDIKRPYQTSNGIEGLVRVFKPYSHIRITWKMPNWSNSSILQIRILGDRLKSTLSFHQDRLLDNNQRQEMKIYWTHIMAEIEKALINKKGNI